VLNEQVEFVKRIDIQECGDAVPGGELSERHLFLGSLVPTPVQQAVLPSEKINVLIRHRHGIVLFMDKGEERSEHEMLQQEMYEKAG
jgi:hypothetical protein